MFRSGSYLFGIKEKEPGYRYSTNEYDISQVILVTRGTLLFECSQGREEIGAHSFCFLPPGSSFTLSCRNEGYKGIAFEMWEPEAPALPPAAGVYQADQRMQLLAGWAEEEYRKSPTIDTSLLMDICRLIYTSGRSIHVSATASAPSRVEEYHTARAAQLLKAHASSGKSVTGILEPLPISYRHLSRYFKKETGVTPKQYRHNCRMELAKEYLEHTNMPPSAIAAELGFSSSQHFSSSFLSFTGLSPVKYRKSIQ